MLTWYSGAISLPPYRAYSSLHRCFYKVCHSAIYLDARELMTCSNGPCIGRIAYMLYKNRLVLKQVTVQGFELLHLFVRLSFFTFFTVIGVACVSLHTFRANVLTH